ncbi:MAG TPA: dTDP-4-dehydrorhamnose reductase [Vicinamibacterales bacterium]
MKVLVLGAAGHLGAAIVHEFGSHSDIVAPAHRDLDITDDGAVLAHVTAAAPDVIVNCAAYNLVDAAEDNPVTALHINAFGVRALARAAAGSGAILVTYSSDFVFDGRTGRPYGESDRPNPQSVYAASKLLGEWFAADAPRHYVLRVESLFGRAPDGPERGSAAAILQRLRSGDEVRVFVDRTVSPTHVLDAAAATRAVVERRLPFGLYHCVNSGQCTWREFAEEAARLIGLEPRLVSITAGDVPMRAMRPKYCALSNEKLAGLGVTMPDWRDALQRAVADASVRSVRAS